MPADADRRDGGADRTQTKPARHSRREEPRPTAAQPRVTDLASFPLTPGPLIERTIMATADGSVLDMTQVFGNAPRNRAFNVVLLAEGFTAAQQNDFDTACMAFVEALLGDAAI